jgi:uncharacterized protein (TIGR03435 family)
MYLLLIVVALLAQAVPGQKKPSFDIVSIKPSPPGNGPRGGAPRGDRLVMARSTLRMLLQNAYPPAQGVNRQLEIIGGPPWMDSEQFDLEAKADCSGGPINRDQYRLMIQSMLEDRFQLKAHTEAREVPVYELVVAKDGLKIRPSADQTPVNSGGNAPILCGPPPTASQTPPVGQRGAPFDPTKMRGVISFQYAPGSTTVIGNAVPLSMLMIVAQQDSGRPVIDKTDGKQLYDFTLRFSPDRMTSINRGEPPRDATAAPVAVDPVPPLSAALQEQLGLKLESTKAPMEELVVESAQKPREN